MIDTQLIEDFLFSEQIAFEKNVDLKTKTWIKRGGIACIWVQPNSLSNFEKLVSWCQLNKVRFEVIGSTSNCYFLNDYNPELVISTLKLNGIKIETDTITCDCGYNMARLAKYCISQGIAGFEGFIGLPGTVGGAAINNSGCYGSLMAEIVQSVTILASGEKLVLLNKQLSYRIRNSALKSKEIDGVILSVTFNTESKEEPTILEKRAKEFQKHRKEFQEHRYPNLGSIFSVLEFKKLSFLSKCVNALVRRCFNLFIRDSEEKLKLKNDFFLWLRKAGKFKKYISNYGIGCFIWKDAAADKYFEEYIDFIKRNTTKAIMEIEIKGRR